MKSRVVVRLAAVPTLGLEKCWILQRGVYLGFFITLIAANLIYGGSTVTRCSSSDLEAAINVGGEVTFECDGVIALTNTIYISSNVVLKSNGHRITVTGNGSVRLFEVGKNTTFKVEGFVLADGRSMGSDGLGGGLSADGGDAFAAGIHSRGGTVLLSNCILSNFWSKGGNAAVTNRIPHRGGGGYGGAVSLIGGQLTASNCIFINNRTQGGMGSGGVGFEAPPPGDGGDAFGGAIYSSGGSIRLVSTTLVGNRVLGGEAGMSIVIPHSRLNVGRGGGAFGGAAASLTNSLLLQECLVASNSVTGGSATPAEYFQVVAGGPAGVQQGGGLYLAGSLSCIGYQSQFLGNSATGSWASLGGAIANEGPLQLTRCLFSQNKAVAENQGSAEGGAISSFLGTLTINESTLEQNRAEGGGGGFGGGTGQDGAGGGVWSWGFLAITNTTFSTNSTRGGTGGYSQFGLGGKGGSGRGGGLQVDQGTAFLANTTFSGNRAEGGYGGFFGGPLGSSMGGGVGVGEAAVFIRDSILAYSSDGGNASGPIHDEGYNISSDATPALSAPGSRNLVDPKLGPLAENGGPTRTIALLPESPAMDAGGPLAGPYDQRGFPRSKPDIGAFEAVGAGSSVILPLRLSSPSTLSGLIIGIPHTTYEIQMKSVIDGEWLPRGFLGTDSVGSGVLNEPIDGAEDLGFFRLVQKP